MREAEESGHAYPAPRFAVRIESLSLAYNSVEVLSDISLSIREGSYVGLVGPNGSGKTTLVRAILGLARISSGRIELFSRPLDGFNQWNRIGYLPQKTMPNSSFPATVEEIVGTGLTGRKKNEKNASLIDSALDWAGITGIRKKLIGDLSGGQQQRALIARALVHQPDLLILDEPTAALDTESRDRFYEMLAGLNGERGTTVILVTHDLGTIGKYASELLYIDRKLIFYGNFEDFCHSPDMARFFGDYSQHIICHRHDR